MNTTNMVCRDVKTLFGFCGHIVFTTVHMRPCPRTRSSDSNNDSDNHDHNHNQQQGPCAGTEPYYVIHENGKCIWCRMAEWIGPEWDSRVGGPNFFRQGIIENRRTAFRNAITATREIEPEEQSQAFENAAYQEETEYDQSHIRWRYGESLETDVYGPNIDDARAARIREPLISKALKPVEGDPTESRCQICCQDYGLREGETDESHDPVIVLCGSNVPHEFGEVCIREWLSTHLSCPVCPGDAGEEYAAAQCGWGKRDRFGRIRWGPVDPVLEELGLLQYQG